MSYTPINWQTGDAITAEKLNKMDNGWDVTTETTVFDGEVTTTFDEDAGYAYGDITLDSPINADTITVTFNGTEYECPNVSEISQEYEYGSPFIDGSFDFSTFPFNIQQFNNYTGICTETGGTYTLKVEAIVNGVSVSNDFENVVKNVANAPLLCVSDVTTYQEMVKAYNDGRLLYCYYDYDGDKNGPLFITHINTEECYFFPDDSSVMIGFDDNIFTIWSGPA